MTQNQTDVGDAAIINKFFALEHNLRHTGLSKIHQVAPQALIVNIPENRYLLIKQLKHKFSNILSGIKWEIYSKQFSPFCETQFLASTKTMPTEYISIMRPIAIKKL